MRNIICLLSMLSVFHAASAQGQRRRPARTAFQTDTPMAHDPVMAYEDSTYHVFSTGVGIQHITSRDLRTWTVLPESLMTVIPAWTHDSVPGFRNHVWAPDIVHWHGRWWLAYSCSTFGKNNSAIGLLSRRSLAFGTWDDLGCIVTSRAGRDNWNAIDPCFVIDEDTDTPWLTWGSFWDGIQLCRLDSTMHIATGERPRTIARRRNSGSNAIEAPFIMRHGPYYYLFVSWDYCCRGSNSSYRVAVGRSRSLTGPYLDRQGKDMADGGGTLLIEGDKQEFEAIGHCAAYHINGQDLYISHGYSTRLNGTAILVVRPISWTTDGWPELRE